MIIDTVKLLTCDKTGNVLNNIPENLRDSISICISNENKASESTVFLAEELVNLYKSVYKGTTKKALLFLYKLLIRVIENGSDRYIDITEDPSIPLKRAALKTIIQRLETLQIIQYYRGWSKPTGSVPACIRAAYSSEELKARAKIALNKKIEKV